MRSFLVGLIALGAAAFGAQPKRVLVIHSFGNAAPPFTTHSAAFETELTEKMGEPVDLDEVSLDVGRYATLDMEEALVDFMRKRQSKWQPDLVVPIGSPAGVFVARHRDRLFPSTTPVIYTGMDQRRLPSGALQFNTAFVGESFDLPGLVEEILQLQPGTTNIAVVLGASPLEQYWAEVLRKEYQRFTDRVSFTWFTDLSFDQMLDRAAKMPPRSFILLILLMRDASGVTHDADEALKRLHAVANAPMNSIFHHQLGLGIVGGRLYQAEFEGIESARIAVRVLHGESITNFSPKIIGPIEPEYDWRELQRWKIEEKGLPPGSKVLFREPTTWERYKWRIIAAASVFAAEGFLIFLLLANLIKRRRAERSAAETEARFRTAVDAAPLMIWMSDTEKLCIFFNKPWLEFTGRQLEQELGKGWADGVHGEDLAACLQTYERAFDARKEFAREYRLRKRDGEYAWVLDHGQPRFSPEGSFLGYIGSATDVTALKQAEERWRSVVEGAPNAIVVINRSGAIDRANTRTEAVFGYPRAELVGKPLSMFLPEFKTDNPGRSVFSSRPPTGRRSGPEFGRRKNGSMVPVATSFSSIRTPEGEFLLAFIIDLTEQVEAEQAAREVSTKLITAQEDERRRLARDLHDDLNQRLALLSVEADLLGRMDHNPKAQPLIEEIASQVRNLSSEVHKLSYQLHPAKLEQLGLVSATRALCQEQGKLLGITIEFIHADVPHDLDRMAALCLYRVVQEALQNMGKHSHATQARVELKRKSDQIRLMVSDNGQGFELPSVACHAGLGLVGMRERVRLARGQISFHSAPGEGTRVEVTIPITLNEPIDLALDQ